MNDAYKDKESKTCIEELVAEGLAQIKEAGRNMLPVPDMQMKEIDKKIVNVSEEASAEIGDMASALGLSWETRPRPCRETGTS